MNKPKLYLKYERFITCPECKGLGKTQVRPCDMTGEWLRAQREHGYQSPYYEDCFKCDGYKTVLEEKKVEVIVGGEFYLKTADDEHCTCRYDSDYSSDQIEKAIDELIEDIEK